MVRSIQRRKSNKNSRKNQRNAKRSSRRVSRKMNRLSRKSMKMLFRKSSRKSQRGGKGELIIFENNLTDLNDISKYNSIKNALIKKKELYEKRINFDYFAYMLDIDGDISDIMNDIDEYLTNNDIPYSTYGQLKDLMISDDQSLLPSTQ